VEPERVLTLQGEQESEPVEIPQTKKEGQAPQLKHDADAGSVNLPEITGKKILVDVRDALDKVPDSPADQVEIEEPEMELPRSIDVGGTKVVEMVTPTVEPPVMQVPSPKATVRDASPPVQAKEAGIKGRVWLTKQKSNRYTLQLIGVQEEYAARQFIQQHGIRDEAAYFMTQRDGKPWFSVVYGVYSGREAAVKAKKKLPASLKSAASWPRSFGSIQQAIGN